MKYVTFILVLCVISVFGRVAEVKKDELNNLIVDEKPVKTQQSIVNNTVEVNIVNNNTDNKVHEKPIDENTNVTKKTCDTRVEDNLLDANHTNTNTTSSNKPCEPEARVDNGTALILTPYLKEGKAREAKRAARVDSKLFLGFKSYSGFLTVNETYNSNIFFWYFPVLNKPVNESPWIIWLQGGPGASSLTGLFDEIGPFTVVNSTLKRNPHTWLHNHSLLFIDNPVGTGYSFTEHNKGFTTNMATYSNHLFIALKQFLQIFPELKTVPLYLAGESYAGKYVPAMAMEIHKRKEKLGSEINLQGLIIGNAYVDPEVISHIALPFHYFGLLEKEQLEMIKPLIDAFQESIRKNNSIEAKNKWNILVSVLLFISSQKHGYNFLSDDLLVGKYVSFLKTTPVKRAIHVGDINFEWVNMTVNVNLAPDFLSSTKPMFERLLEHYRVLAYWSSPREEDGIKYTLEPLENRFSPCLKELRRNSVLTGGFSIFKLPQSHPDFVLADLWQLFSEVADKCGPGIPRKQSFISRYHKTGGRLTEVVFRGAGHMVPLDKPAPAENLVARWTHSKPLSRRYGLLEGSYIQEYIRNNTIFHYL
ncbi:venom serine carboxypeptidase-like [Spodoptera litura]|uniref:Carboxypeptidase n=1 Tax=Spodoptera litura TaxID=69820 RepID=A0A9J7DXU3_SPOLT|nr:venom serine carboxypeptidase-like [Spodoptera litura]